MVRKESVWERTLPRTAADPELGSGSIIAAENEEQERLTKSR
jgi:hypothetical protein